MKNEGYSLQEIKDQLSQFQQYKVNKFKNKHKVGAKLEDENMKIITSSQQFM